MLVFDIGGSFIKYALTDESGHVLPGTQKQAPADANGSYEHFLATLSGIIAEASGMQDIRRACVSVPEPFDFARGISLMKHKFTALYNKSITGPFEEAGIPVTFLHDSTAYLLGEADRCPGGSSCGIMLGTGLGFAFMRDGLVCVDENDSPAVLLWNTPWKGGIAEDAVSTRTLCTLYGETLPIRDLADRARAGDIKAQDAFLQVGASLSEIVAFVVERLGCDHLMLGGQISRSADLFHLSLPIPWDVCANPSEVALAGAGRYASLGREACVKVIPHIDLVS